MRLNWGTSSFQFPRSLRSRSDSQIIPIQHQTPTLSHMSTHYKTISQRLYHQATFICVSWFGTCLCGSSSLRHVSFIVWFLEEVFVVVLSRTHDNLTDIYEWEFFEFYRISTHKAVTCQTSNVRSFFFKEDRIEQKIPKSVFIFFHASIDGIRGKNTLNGRADVSGIYILP
jgi:hypothetical protein